jgi:predicted lipoprotein with Yx(FWY)xxD motif
MNKSKRLPFYVAAGAGVSALAATVGLTLANSSSSASAITAAPTATVVETRNTSLGQILVDAQGRTLYLFARDDRAASNCTGSCASVWPAVPVSGTPTASGGALAADVNVITGSDGARQLAYAGHPLYYFAGDNAAGQTRGQAIDEFGAKWYVLNPAGDAVTAAASTANIANTANTSTGGYGY